MNKKNNKEEILDNNRKKNDNNFGADSDEQEMNGMYGMLETEYEDKLHDKDN